MICFFGSAYDVMSKFFESSLPREMIVLNIFRNAKPRDLIVRVFPRLQQVARVYFALLLAL